MRATGSQIICKIILTPLYEPTVGCSLKMRRVWTKHTTLHWPSASWRATNAFEYIFVNSTACSFLHNILIYRKIILSFPKNQKYMPGTRTAQPPGERERYGPMSYHGFFMQNHVILNHGNVKQWSIVMYENVYFVGSQWNFGEEIMLIKKACQFEFQIALPLLP